MKRAKIAFLAALIACTTLLSGCALIIDSIYKEESSSNEEAQQPEESSSIPTINSKPSTTAATTTAHKKHTIKFETNGGSYVYPVTSTVLMAGPGTSKDGYLFDGWYNDQTFKSPTIFPVKLDKDMTIYAKWIKLEETKTTANVSIKHWDDLNSSVSWSLTPNGFDLDRLQIEGYSMTITVQYDVRYEKDYDALWDIGYMGSPKYEAKLSSSRGYKDSRRDLKTTTDIQSRSLSITSSIADLKNSTVTLTFSTDNIQNIIHFENITITYTCFK